MNKKNTLRIMVCFILVAMLAFVFASCDKIEGIFKKHEHSYTHTVTLPTCESQGYTTHTCECGDSYVDAYVPESHELVVRDAKEPTCTEPGNLEYFTCRKCDYTTYEAIPATGHSFEEKITRFPTTQHTGVKSRICSECGETHDEELKAVSVTLPRVAELIHSFVGMNQVSINADNTEIVFIDRIEDENGLTDRYIAVDLTRFELDGTGDELVAHITFELGIATLDPSVEGAEPEFTTEMLIDVFANGDEVSVAVTEGTDTENTDVNLTEEFYGYIAENLGMTYDELIETYYLVEKLAGYLPVIEGILEWAGSIELPDGTGAGESILALLAEKMIKVDDDGYYYIDVEGLIEIIEDSRDKTVGALIDEYFGKGTMAGLETFLVALPMTKVRTLAKSAELFAETYDIPLDDVYALINYVIYLATGEDFNVEHEIKVRYNKTVAEVIIELANQGEEITEADINTMALAMVNEIKNLVDLIKKNNVDQLYNIYYYDDADFNYSLTADIITRLEEFDASFDAMWHYDEDGMIDHLCIDLAGIFGINYGVIDGSEITSVTLYVSEEATINLTLYATETKASLEISSDDNKIVSLVINIKDGELTDAEFKINAVYVGKLEGFDGEENLINIITATYLKGENGAFETTFVLNAVSEKDGETDEDTVSVLEKALDVNSTFDGVDTLVTIANGKVITVKTSEDGTGFDITVKEGETLLAELTAALDVTLDDNGFVTEAHGTLVGVIEGVSVDVKIDYADSVLTALCKLDGKEAVDVTVTVSEDGSIDFDCDLNGVSITTEILDYIGALIDALNGVGGLIEPLPEVAA